MDTTVNKRSVGSDLTTGPILKTLLWFAIPIVLTNLIQQAYSLIDLIVIKEYVGNIGTVGVNTGGEIADLVMPIASGFAMAGQIYIAQLVGASERNKTKKAIGTLLAFCIYLSVILTVVSILFCKPILTWLKCPVEAMAQAEAYMIVTSLGYPFIFGYNAVCGVLRGMGESKKPLYYILVAATTNIVLDVLLVAVFKLEAAGTAVATVVSQFASFAAAFYSLWKNREHFDFELSFHYFKIDFSILQVFIRLGIPQVFRSMCVRFGMVWVNKSANAYGMIVSATNSVGNKLQKFLEVFISGVDTASASMVGQCLGAKDIERSRKTTIYTFASAFMAAIIISILCLTIPKPIFSLFSKDSGVIELGAVYLKIFVLHFLISAVTGSFQAMVTGSGFVELGFVLGLLDGLICKIGFSYFFAYVLHMGYEGLWLGVATSRLPNAFITVIYFLSGKWKTRKLLTE